MREIALDLRRYNTPEKLGNLVNDTASLAIEAASSDIARVNPSFFVKKNKDYVIAPGRDKRDVTEMFVAGDPSTGAAMEIRDFLLDDSASNIYVWISPSGEWPETRVQVGVKMKTKNQKYSFLKRYDISTTMKPEQCLATGQLLASISEGETPFPLKPDDLRERIYKIKTPEGTNPFVYLSDLIEFPEKDRWPSITSGDADRVKRKAIKAAVVATAPIRQNPHVIYSAPRDYGAYIETRMKHEGYGMDPVRFGCGGSNITTSPNSLSYTESSTPSYGYDILLGSFPCPRCNGPIPSGLGLTTCPHCGLTKEQAGSTCG